MIDTKKIEQFAKYLHESVPKIIHDFACNLDSKIYKILQNQINRMNFVNRDEFDIHAQILFQTQEKIKKLEIKLKTLESTIYQNQNSNKNKNNQSYRE